MIRGSLTPSRIVADSSVAREGKIRSSIPTEVEPTVRLKRMQAASISDSSPRTSAAPGHVKRRPAVALSVSLFKGLVRLPAEDISALGGHPIMFLDRRSG